MLLEFKLFCQYFYYKKKKHFLFLVYHKMTENGKIVQTASILLELMEI